MRRIGTMIGLLTGAALLAVPLLAQDKAAQPGAPSLQLSAMKWEFGTVWHGETPKFTLILTNVGTAELKISRVQPSCGCTAAEPAKYTLAPNESTDIAITYNTQGKQGKQTSHVTIFSNDPAKPQVQFDLFGEVKRAVTMEPMGGLVIRAVDEKAVHTGKVRLMNNEEQPLKVAVNTMPGKEFDIQLKEIEPGKVWEIVATTKPPLQLGTTQSAISISTGLTREPNMSIPVVARIMERVTLVPPALLFIKADTAPAKRGISVEYYGKDDNWKVTEVKTNNPKVKAVLGPISPPPQWQIDLPPTPKFVVSISLEIPPGPEIPDEGIPLEIFTTDPDYGVVTCFITTKNEVFQAYTHRQGPTSRPAPKAPAAASPGGAPASAPAAPAAPKPEAPKGK